MPLLNQKRTRIVVGVLAASVIATGAVTAYAFKTIFQRPGEGALRFVPANALMVATLDLSPSPQQALVFKKIDDALARNELAGKLDASIIDVMATGEAAKDLRDLTLRSGAVAMLPPSEGDKPEKAGFVGFIGLKDGPAAAAALRKHGKAMFFRGTQAYKLKDGPLMMVVDNLLAVSDEAKNLNLIEQVAEGAPNILSNKDFLEGRSRIDQDANFMLMVSPGIEGFVRDSVKELKLQGKMLTHWVGVSMAIRDNGIGIVANGKVNGAEIPGYMKVAATPLLRSDLFDVLPSGAYGLIAASAPVTLFDYFEDFMKGETSFKEGLTGFEKEMKDNTGMDLRQDVLANLRGDAIFVAYPTYGEKGGIDVLAVVDDQNGAKPAAAVDKLMAWVEEQTEKEKQPMPFTLEKIGDDRVYVLSGKPADEMKQGMKIEDPTFKGDLITKDKTVAFGLVGNNLMVSSSKALLLRAMVVYKSKQGGLSGDEAWQGSKALVADTQHMMAFSLARIGQGVLNTMNVEKMDEAGRKQAQDITSMLSSMVEPLSMRSLIKEDGYATSMFIPMEYDKMIDLVGTMFKETAKKPALR